MKLKMDFITNSSSASFILYVTSSASKLNDFILNWDNFVTHYINTYSYKLLQEVEGWRESRNKTIERKKYLEEIIKNNDATEHDKLSYDYVYSHIKPADDLSDYAIMRIMLGEMNINFISNNIFTVTNSTMMLNDLVLDLPTWMNYLIVLNNMGDPKLLEFGIQNVKLEVDRDH